MGYGRFVGRVGALAVALGVGMMAPAVAAADTDTDGPANTQTDSSGAAGSTADSSSQAADAAGDSGKSGAASPSAPGDDADDAAADDDAAGQIGSDSAELAAGDDVSDRRTRKSNRTTASTESINVHADRDAERDAARAEREAQRAVARADRQAQRDAARAERRAQPSVRLEPIAAVASMPSAQSAQLTPRQVDAPASEKLSLPVAVLGGLGVLPAGPSSPASGGPLRDLLWGAYRRTESDEQQQVSTFAAPMTMMTAAAVSVPPSVTYSVGDRWADGFIGNMTVKAGDSSLNGWTVEFDSPAQITNIWNAEIASRTANHYVVRNAPWNGKVGAGQSTAFGFQAAGTSTTVSNLTINGTPVGQPSPPSITIADASVSEGSSGTKNLTFNVALSSASASQVTVGYATVNGTATAGQDYTAKSGTLTFAPGVTSQQVSVAVAGDTTVEPNESFTVTLSNPAGATIADGSAVGTITNDDTQAPGAPSVDYSVTDRWADGFTANMTVKAGGAALNGWTVEFDSPAQITNIWNGEIASRTGTHYVVRNAPWNGQVGAGQSTSFGFQAAGTSTAVSNLTVNGTPVSQPTTPSISIADTSVAEGNSGTRGATFTVSLSGASTNPVTVGYSTANDTATAGQDFTATSGTLTFAPGVTSQQVTVAVIGDTTVEPSETFTVTLANPSGATIADGSATGTITNDDTQTTTPGVSISDASALEGDPGQGGIAPGPLSTSGNQIIDSTGKPVQISGVNWFGFESETRSPHGLWTRNYKDMIDQMSTEGFNTIRLPYSSEMLHNNAAPTSIDYSKNPDLQGLSSLQVMDKIIEYAGQKGMKVILDHHRSDAGAGASPSGLWYEGAYTEDQWVADWQMLANRYKGNSTVIGADLHNEPHNGTWGGGGTTDWARAAERAGNAIHQVNRDWLVFVEGVETYQGQNYWWGGNLMGVKDRPIVLTVPNKVVYSPHDYPNSVYAQPWFQGDNFGSQLPAKFRQMWGYIYEQNIAPIYVGEFGTRLQDPKDAVWFEAITSYLSGDFDNNGNVDIPAGTEDMSWTFWSWNPNSTDTGGILADDWRTVNENKMVYLTPIEYATGTGGTSLATFQITLTQPATVPVTVSYATSNGTATAGSDYTAASGSVTFAPGETRKTVTVVVLGDNAAEGSENFTVLLSNPVGATVVDGSGRATIVDDESV